MFGVNDNSYNQGGGTAPQGMPYPNVPPSPAPSQSPPVFHDASAAGQHLNNSSAPPAPNMHDPSATWGQPPEPAPGPLHAGPPPTDDNVTPVSDSSGHYGISDAPASTGPATDPAAANGDLLDIKHQALQSLAPLVDKLDQTPEEKFKTTMMMIQASDNADLINEAYAVTHQIEDEKARAQALLDIVNEINYFTQKPNP